MNESKNHHSWTIVYYLVMKKTSMETISQLKKFSVYPEILKTYKSLMNSENEFETKIIIPRNLKVEI